MRTLILVLRLFNVQATEHAPHINEAARRYDFDPLLIAAIIHSESRFKNKTCYRGSHGLMQIQLKGRSCKVTMATALQQKLYDPRANILRGAKIMSWWRGWWRKHHSNDGYHWLLHYNQGFGVCPRKRCSRRERIPIRTGKVGGYADRVLRVYRKLKLLEAKIRHEQVQPRIQLQPMSSS